LSHDVIWEEQGSSGNFIIGFASISRVVLAGAGVENLEAPELLPS